MVDSFTKMGGFDRIQLRSSILFEEFVLAANFFISEKILRKFPLYSLKIWMKLDKTKKQQSIFFLEMTVLVILFRELFSPNQDDFSEIERGFTS